MSRLSHEMTRSFKTLYFSIIGHCSLFRHFPHSSQDGQKIIYHPYKPTPYLSCVMIFPLTKHGLSRSLPFKTSLCEISTSISLVIKSQADKALVAGPKQISAVWWHYTFGEDQLLNWSLDKTTDTSPFIFCGDRENDEQLIWCALPGSPFPYFARFILVVEALYPPAINLWSFDVQG